MTEMVERDSEGYLINPESWTKEIAIQIAQEEELELNMECWIIIDFIRDYYSQRKIAVDIRHVVKHLATQLNCDKKQARNKIFKLFPYGYVKQTCKIAGMKRPRGWSSG
ncbi:MAG: TusE/DsrC/DsvC family sulfur relay protein [Proteobacteria bacterium]|nr:TusE/DsrC/DsvC family sulfur relay protein [Pseudomonadota bacterium]